MARALSCLSNYIAPCKNTETISKIKGNIALVANIEKIPSQSIESSQTSHLSKNQAPAITPYRMGDSVIPEEEIVEQIDSLPPQYGLDPQEKTRTPSIIRLIPTPLDHTHNWAQAEDPLSFPPFARFLEDAKLRRPLFQVQTTDFLPTGTLLIS
jgi:hypothetical protein